MASRRSPDHIDWNRSMPRRDFLRLATWVVGGTAAASLLGACAPRRDASQPAASPGGSGAVAGVITLIAGGGDPFTEPPLRKVFDDFRTLHPAIEWDVRSLPGGGPEWDRLARALLASGDPVDLVMMNGQQVRAWARDGLLADLGEAPGLSPLLDRVPARFQIGGPGDSARRAVPLAMTRGLQVTGLYYNKAILDEAGLKIPETISDLESMVQPLAGLGVAPLVHCSGDVFFNQILITWILPMIVEQAGADPQEFAERTIKGEIGYDSPEWVKAFATIANLRASGVLLEGSGATDYGAMQQLLLQGKAATTFQGSWMLSQIQAGTPSGPFDLHVAAPPRVDAATRSRPILAWAGFGIPASSGRSREAVNAFLEYASRPEVDRSVVKGSQTYSPIDASNVEIVDPIAREFLPLFDDAIRPLDWLWEPEIVAEIDSQVQALVKGETEARASAAAVESVAKELRATGRSYYP